MKNLNTLHSSLLSSLKIEKFNQMQKAVITQGCEGRSLLVLSPTGSGKTISFLTVVLNRLKRSVNGVTSIIVVPSRELAIQIDSVFRAIKSNFKVTCCYGGHSSKIERERLKETPALVIGTPGRILDHIERNALSLDNVDLIILDEFDKLLELGFEEEIGQLFEFIKAKSQVILTSASSIDSFQSFPEFIFMERFSTIDYNKQVESTLKLRLVDAENEKKVDSLIELIKEFNQEPTVVFCNHRQAVDRISIALKNKNFEHGVFHGGLEQIEREKSLIKFRGAAHNVLIATDLASRGLDIPEIKHIVHYQLPLKDKEFTHRNGRTARMHAEGTAYLLLEEKDELPKYISQEIKKFKFDPSYKVNPQPEFACIYVSAGKKDKVNKGDLLGFLTKTAGLAGSDVGLISVLDNSSYVSVKRAKVDSFLGNLNNPKIKKQKVKIQLAN